jgi:hypothetical protein
MVYKKERKNVGRGAVDEWRQGRKTQSGMRAKGTYPKRWQCHTGNAAVPVTPHATVKCESTLLPEFAYNPPVTSKL